MKRLLATCVTLWLLVGGTAYGQSESLHVFEGTWKLNVATSAATSVPKAEIQVITIEGSTKIESTDMTTPDGKTVIRTTYTAPANDGKWHPVKDRDSGKTTGSVMIALIDSNTHIQIQKREDGTVAFIGLIVAANDGKTFTLNVVRPDGKSVSNYLFEKQ